MKSETNSSNQSVGINGGGTRPAAFAGAPPQSGKALRASFPTQPLESVEQVSNGAHAESGGLTAPSARSKREILRPGSRISYSLKSIDPQKRYTQTGLARALGCSDETIRRMKLRTITGPHGERKYLGQHVIDALRGKE